LALTLHGEPRVALTSLCALKATQAMISPNRLLALDRKHVTVTRSRMDVRFEETVRPIAKQQTNTKAFAKTVGLRRSKSQLFVLRGKTRCSGGVRIVTPRRTMVTCAEGTWSAIERVRAGGPLVQCITNFVSMDLMANTLLSSGAYPAMVHSPDEVEDFVGIASALLINIGTLSSSWVSAMKLAITKANELGKPWVFDPVGAGATPYRTKVCVELMRLGPAVVRGNASEIIAMAGVDGLTQTRGVDSTASSMQAVDAAKLLATQYKCVVAVSGAVDVVTDGKQELFVRNGVPMLTKITAAGCSVTALIAAFVATSPPEERVSATAHALAYFGVAAEESSAKGPGSLRVDLLDNLYTMDESRINEQAVVEK